MICSVRRWCCTAAFSLRLRGINFGVLDSFARRRADTGSEDNQCVIHRNVKPRVVNEIYRRAGLPLERTWELDKVIHVIAE
jgi:hypothetical protein